MLHITTIFFGSALVFWGPDFLARGLLGKENLGFKYFIFLTFAIPVISLYLIPRLIRYFPEISCSKGASIALFGIWFAGSIPMFVTGMGNANIKFSWLENVSVLLLFPLTTIMSSAYTGSFYALIITSMGLVLFGMKKL